jgi:hypothetical protein
VPWSLCELPHLPDHQQLAHPRRGVHEQLEGPAAREDPRRERPRKLVAQVLLQSWPTLNRDVVQAGVNLYLAKPIRSFPSQHVRDIRTAGYLGDDGSKPTPGGYDT